MTYTVWSGEELLGESELELPPGARGERSGIFRPAPVFERLAPLFRRRQEMVGRLAQAALSRPPDAPPAEAMRRVLQESGLGAELRGTHAALRALQLDVRDAAGASLAPREVNFFDILLLEPAAGAEHMREELVAAGLDPDGPCWLVQVLAVAEDPRGEGEWEPERAVG